MAEKKVFFDRREHRRNPECSFEVRVAGAIMSEAVGVSIDAQGAADTLTALADLSNFGL